MNNLILIFLMIYKKKKKINKNLFGTNFERNTNIEHLIENYNFLGNYLS